MIFILPFTSCTCISIHVIFWVPVYGEYFANSLGNLLVEYALHVIIYSSKRISLKILSFSCSDIIENLFFGADVVNMFIFYLIHIILLFTLLYSIHISAKYRTLKQVCKIAHTKRQHDSLCMPCVWFLGLPAHMHRLINLQDKGLFF